MINLIALLSLNTLPTPPPKAIDSLGKGSYAISIEAPELLQAPVPAKIEELAIIPSYTSNTATSPVISSSVGNTYSPGYCTYGVKMWRPDIPNGLGNASQWFYNAQAMGMAVGYTPAIGAVAVAYGNHVALVIGVNGDTVTIQEMNYRSLGDVNVRDTPASEWRYIY